VNHATSQKNSILAYNPVYFKNITLSTQGFKKFIFSEKKNCMILCKKKPAVIPETGSL